MTRIRRLALRIVFWVVVLIGGPITTLQIALNYPDGHRTAPELAEPLVLALVAIAILWGLRHSDRVAVHAVVVGLGFETALAFFGSGPGISLGALYIAWVATAAFFYRQVLLPVFVMAGVMLAAGYAALNGLVAVEWQSGADTSFWVFNLVTATAIGLGLGYGFQYVLNELEQALVAEGEARRLAREAFAAREEALTHHARRARLEALGRLAGGVAHDFNNALGVLLLGLESLRHRPDEAETAAVLAEMDRATRGAQATTRQLLSMARQGSAPGGRCVPTRVVDEMAATLRRLFPETIRIEVRAEGAGSIGLAVGELEQVLLNLCLNSRDAMPAGGRLMIRTLDRPSPERSEVVLEVEDTGEGMPEEVRLQALEPWFTTKELGAGSGLGLAMVATTVASAGGTIDITSAPAAGTRVRLTFPAAVEVGGEAAPTRPASQTPSAEGQVVLVVEDAPDLRRLITRMLAQAGYQVMQGETIAAGIGQLETGARIDLLLTDAVLPDGGPAVLVERYRDRFPGGPVLICSGYLEEPSLLAGIEQQHFAFLQKPFDMPTLLDAVRGLIESGHPRPVG